MPTNTTLNIPRTRALLQAFDFKTLFIEELGWLQPTRRELFSVAYTPKGESPQTAAQQFSCTPIAQLGGAVILEVSCPGDELPNAKAREAVQREVEKRHYEHVLIFVAAQRSQSLWYWVKHEAANARSTKRSPRDHYYFKGQPADLHLSKLAAMNVDLAELGERGDLAISDIAARLKHALDVERATKKFFPEYDEQRLAFLGYLTDIKNEHDRRWYASVLLNRLMFIYFLQGKFFLDGGDANYLRNKLTASQQRGKDQFFASFLRPLFFEGFAKPEAERSTDTNKLLGNIVYLNGGLFLPHKIEADYGTPAQPASKLNIADAAFENILSLFERYSWNLNDTPGGAANEINPDVLGYIFEQYINQKEFGAYYTRPEITEYLCEQTIHELVLDAVNPKPDPATLHAAGLRAYHFESVPELLAKLDARLCNQLLNSVLPGLSLLDPACGSGAFLVAALKTLVNIYSAIIGKAETLNDPALSQWLRLAQQGNRSIAYFIKKQIITNNLFGVDIMDEAVEIARLRLFLALVSSVEAAEQLQPLPNIDFNLLPGNSLIGLLRPDESALAQLQNSLLSKSYRSLVDEKNALVLQYRNPVGDDLRALRQSIDDHRSEANAMLNDQLLTEFNKLHVQVEQATWDEQKNAEGKPKKRALTLADVQALHPFHWGYEFDEVMHTRGGFDAIITNPPWEIFKPQAKEFFAQHSDLVTKNAMTIKDFEKEQTKLLKDKAVRAAWLAYQSQFPHVSDYFRSAPQFANQISVVNGKKAGSDINLYKLFTEQCFNLLRAGGLCGTVIPSGIYTDLGAKQLREMLFGNTQVRGLFCFENRKLIFEGVDSRFKFVALSFEKGGSTTEFPAAFMRHEVSELQRFPREGALMISVPLVRRLSPDSLSVMEFKSNAEILLLEKISALEFMSSPKSAFHHIKFEREFDPTANRSLFLDSARKDLLPLLEGRNIHQFSHVFSSERRFWIREHDGRSLILGRHEDSGQTLSYQKYRLAFRKIARNTDERTMISTVIPQTFASENLQTAIVCDNKGNQITSDQESLALCSIFNSFVFDFLVRMKVTANMNFFFVYSTHLPNLNANDPAFAPIVGRAARLVCLGQGGLHPEFAALWAEVMPKDPSPQPLTPAARAALRAELDGLVAHLYGLSEAEFVHVLAAFPLVAEPVKVAAQNAYRDVGNGLIK